MAGEQRSHIREFLRSSVLFEVLTDEELDRIVPLCRQETYDIGTVILSEDSVAETMFIVEKGRVAIEMAMRLGPQSRRLATIHVASRGEPVGWSVVRESQRLTMSARCLDETRLIGIDGPSLSALMDEDYGIGYKVMKRLVTIISSRLSDTRDTLAHILAIASHDLKAPLVAVQSYLQVLSGGYAGPISDRQQNMLLRSSDRMSELLNLIDDILDLSRIETREFEVKPFSLVEIAARSVESISPLAERKGISLETDAAEPLPDTVGSPSRLQQVITNLLTNAIKFTPDKGTVILRLSDEGDYLVVQVIDTGIGIPLNDLPQIFDDFYRGSNAQTKGAGLGLSIAKKIISAHGGKIWAESPYPPDGTGGSSFTFTLPKKSAVSAGSDTRLSLRRA